MKKYSFWKGLFKSIVNGLIIGFPFLIQMTPQTWKNLTVGGLMYLIYNYMKVRWQMAYGTQS